MAHPSIVLASCEVSCTFRRFLNPYASFYQSPTNDDRNSIVNHKPQYKKHLDRRDHLRGAVTATALIVTGLNTRFSKSKPSRSRATHRQNNRMLYSSGDEVFETFSRTFVRQTKSYYSEPKVCSTRQSSSERIHKYACGLLKPAVSFVQQYHCATIQV